MKLEKVILCLVISVIAFVIGQQVCVTDVRMNRTVCQPGEYLTKHGSGPCPICAKFSGCTNPCDDVGNRCAPGLKCEPPKGCVLDLESCHYYLHLSPEFSPLNPPTCNIDGTYAPRQCRGTGRFGSCFCVASDGRRIFGRASSADASDMTCACSRRRSELEAMRTDAVTLHCSSNGNYERLQCDSDLCWCANEKTGEPESTVVSSNLVAQLPCYNSVTYGSTYLRVCESKLYAVSQYREILRIHGTRTLLGQRDFCDYDGTFGSYQIEMDILFCSWRDRSRISIYQDQADSELVNCNCARDTKYFEEANSIQIHDCQGNGNYRPAQQLHGIHYCIDEHGFPQTGEESEERMNCTKYNPAEYTCT